MATERKGVVTLHGRPFTLVGDEIKVGDPAPDFTAVDVALAPYSLKDGTGRVRILNVVVSIDTPTCEAQTRRFNQEAAKLEGVEVLTASVDLPFALGRWSSAEGVDRIKMLSDHRDLSLGTAYGILVKELRTLGRGIFVIDADDRIVHAEYVHELSEQPDYDQALAAAQEAAGR
jgi:thioredoxin-dependent peroxiredoxin